MDGHTHRFDDDRPRHIAHHWTVLTTAMVRSEAEATARWICATYPQVHATPVDPASSLTLTMDRATVTKLRAAAFQYLAEGGDAGSLLDDFDEWLEATADH
jgi:hypothetical protein